MHSMAFLFGLKRNNLYLWRQNINAMPTNQLKLPWVSPTLLILFLLIFSTYSLTAQQKRAMEAEDYPGMQNISKKGISVKGRFVYYVISPMQYGDPMIVLHDLKQNRIDTIFRTKEIWFSPVEDWYAYLRIPPFAEVRAAKLKDPKAAEKFDDTLVIVAERKKEIQELVYPAVKSVIAPSEGSSRYMALLIKKKKRKKSILTPYLRQREILMTRDARPVVLPKKLTTSVTQ
jgi:hypothetical protein